MAAFLSVPNITDPSLPIDCTGTIAPSFGDGWNAWRRSLALVRTPPVLCMSITNAEDDYEQCFQRAVSVSQAAFHYHAINTSIHALKIYQHIRVNHAKDAVVHAEFMTELGIWS
eukprot:scaffold76951_cov25-Prasinocladus_malaysianus.AAC.1